MLFILVTAGPWENPFVIGKDGDRKTCIDKYKEYAILNGIDIRARKELKGKILGCFCKPKECHGDILATWANEE
jgi:hypothetical protein